MADDIVVCTGRQYDLLSVLHEFEGDVKPI